MIKQIILAFPDFRKPVPENDQPFLNIAEFYCDTIQGEGINIGQPAAFLRMQNCSLNCWYCDTEEVWRKGNPYTFEELFDLMNEVDLPSKLKNGQHLVLTGGSPLLQQEGVAAFLLQFMALYGFKPYIEIENECAIMPTRNMIDLVDCWNNSPKLSGSGNPNSLRYRPEILRKLSVLNNSWFKIVVGPDTRWIEIQSAYINHALIDKPQIILMPQGATRKELEDNREMVIEMAVENNVKYCTREHIVLWDKKTGA